jgi:hypothetical protein
MRFSLVPLLLGNRDISTKAREALHENRLMEAAKLIMREYGLTCIEASQLLDVSACDE